jgi:hypothetical protein
VVVTNWIQKACDVIEKTPEPTVDDESRVYIPPAEASDLFNGICHGGDALSSITQLQAGGAWHTEVWHKDAEPNKDFKRFVLMGVVMYIIDESVEQDVVAVIPQIFFKAFVDVLKWPKIGSRAFDWFREIVKRDVQ